MLLHNKIISAVIISSIFSYALDTKFSSESVKIENNVLDLSVLKEKDLKIIEELKENSIETDFNDEFLEKDILEDDKSLLLTESISPIIVKNKCKSVNGIVLQNGYVATCVTPDGTFGARYYKVGMTFNPNGNATTFQDDYLQPGAPWEYFSISVDNNVFTNNNTYSGTPSITTNISSLGGVAGGVLAKSTINGYPNLKIKQEYTLDPLSNSIKIRVIMTNRGINAIESIKYARGLDPDPDVQQSNNFKTLNKRGYTFLQYPLTILPENIAWSIGKKNHKMVSLYSVDPIKHNTCISPYWTTVPSRILSSISPYCINPTSPNNYTYGDYTINIAFDMKYLMPKETKVILFKYVFDNPKNIMPLIYKKKSIKIVDTISTISTLEK